MNNPPVKKKRWPRRLAWAVLTLFILMNVVAFFHAYTFTHFSDATGTKTKSENLGAAGKVKALFFGINNPRPVSSKVPEHPFETITLQSNKKIECWLIKQDSARGTVILFHGYGGEKSSLLDKAERFREMGFNTFLVDFMGSGGSEGNQTTIGFKEAAQVKTCFDYISSTGEKNIFLFGTSLGAAAILKSIHDYALNPAGIIIECPFGTLYKTTVARFEKLGVPSFPMAGLLVFWGGIQNGFWGFSHKPEEYAKAVTCPALLMYGEKDEKVSRSETDKIFSNLKGRKSLVTFPNAAHENYLVKYDTEWTQAVSTFLQ